jgi:hypothetical protein
MTTERLVSEVLHSADGIAAAAANAAMSASGHYTQQHALQQQRQGQQLGSGSWSPLRQSGMAGAAGKLQGEQQQLSLPCNLDLCQWPHSSQSADSAFCLRLSKAAATEPPTRVRGHVVTVSAGSCRSHQPWGQCICQHGLC